MSAILSADDLNDFISPGVACIKPVETLPTSAPQPQDTDSPEISFNDTENSRSNLMPAQISLTDCLACSGCVTSAEAVLVSLQSHAEVLAELDSAPGLRISSDGSIENLEHGGQIYVASVSPQSRASIAATFGVTLREAGYMIDQLLSGNSGIKSRAVYRNAFQWVLDTNMTREACLVLGAEEVVASMDAAVHHRKPILTSSCPGWVCYAEKMHPHILPHLSRLKSPQALMGTLVKSTLSRKFGIAPDRIWHMAIMPCFDKKLEASREELTDTAWGETGTKGIRDVDLVITSKELLMLAESRRVDFANLPRMPVSKTPFPDAKLDSFLFPKTRRQKNQVPESGTSGGNLYYILQCFASRQPGASIQTTRGRNADVWEYTVTSATGDTLLMAARYYGFRNIQNLVRRLRPPRTSRMPGAKPIGSSRKPMGKSPASECSYIEVMACPGGCTNGGGQIKVDDPFIASRETNELKPGPQEQKEWLAKVDEAYFSAEDNTGEDTMIVERGYVDGIHPLYIRDTLAHWASTTGISLDRLVYTSYREVFSDVGEKVSHTQSVIEIAGKIGGGW